MDNRPKVTFDDVAGCDEWKNLEVVQFLGDPSKFTSRAKVPAVCCWALRGPGKRFRGQLPEANVSSSASADRFC